MAVVIRGRPLVAGAAEGRAVCSDQPLSFWGGYDQRTGEIVDRRHPLSGVIAAGAVLVLPGSRGSSTTSAVLLEAAMLGTAPAAIVTTGADRFVAIAGVVAQEMFATHLPVVSVAADDLGRIPPGALVRLDLDGTLTIESAQAMDPHHARS